MRLTTFQADKGQAITCIIEKLEKFHAKIWKRHSILGALVANIMKL
jgi:hypothetical protein